MTSVFDAADRITTAGYTYDGLGRTRTVPAGHTDQPSGSNLTANYFGNDMVAKLTQTVPAGAGTTVKAKSFGLDLSLRLSTMSDSTGGVELRKTVNHYADSSDSPSWIATQTRPDAATGWSSSWSRNVVGPDGDLAIIQPHTGGAKIQLANLHGDVVATLDNAPYVGLGSFVEPTEYGQARAGAASLGQNYGWLGTERRSTDSVGGLTLMGVRLYNPTTGRFLSRDPVPGGNDNTYIYPVDPITITDISGACPFCAVPWALAACRLACKPALRAAGMAVIRAVPKRSVKSVPAFKPRIGAKIKNISGREIKFGNNIRISLLGNRTGHPTGRFPHYHRRKVGKDGSTIPGQGIGRHRPWDKKKPDKRSGIGSDG